jgi:hypothetical protein
MMTRKKVAIKAFGALVAVVVATSCVRTSGQTLKMPFDPGVHGGAAGAGTPLKGLTADENAFFRDGLARFAEVEVVTGGNNNGLGPRFNSNQCLSCHAQPAVGGSSPAQNPSIRIATLNGARNAAPWFVTRHRQLPSISQNNQASDCPQKTPGPRNVERQFEVKRSI